MTFGEARIELRRLMLDTVSEFSLDDGELLEYLVDAAREVAAAFQFPTSVETEAVAAGATQFSVDASARALVLNQVSYGGFSLVLKPLATVLQFVSTASMERPRYYSYDARRGDTVTFAPAAPAGGGTFTYEYVELYPSAPVTAASDVWDGLFPAFQFLVPLGGAARAFDALMQYDKAKYFLDRQNAKALEFGQMLNRRPLNELVGGDPGRREEDRVVPRGETT